MQKNVVPLSPSEKTGRMDGWLDLNEIARVEVTSEATFHDIVRQQFNFSPPSSTQEEENCRVELAGVTDFELTVVPDVSGGGAYAALTELRLS